MFTFTTRPLYPRGLKGLPFDVLSGVFLLIAFVFLFLTARMMFDRQDADRRNEARLQCMREHYKLYPGHPMESDALVRLKCE